MWECLQYKAGGLTWKIVFNVVNDLEHTETSIYGIFDGHGGEVVHFNISFAVYIFTNPLSFQYIYF